MPATNTTAASQLDSSYDVTSAKVILATVFAVLAVLIVSGNALTIATFTANSHFWRRSLYLVINLAVVDLLMGLIALPMYITLVCIGEGLWQNSRDTWWSVYKVYTGFDAWLGLASLLSFTFIALERMYATVWPLRHRQMLWRKYGYIIAISWILPALHTIIFCKLSRYLEIIASLMLCALPFLSIFIIFTSYTAIFISYKRRTFRNFGRSCIRERHERRDRQLSYTLSHVTLVSLITWMPFAIVNMMYSLSYYFHLPMPSIFYDYEAGKKLLLGLKFLQYTNSCVNPIIYAIKIKHFRLALYQLLSNCTRVHRRNHGYRPQLIPLRPLVQLGHDPC